MKTVDYNLIVNISDKDYLKTRIQELVKSAYRDGDAAGFERGMKWCTNNLSSDLPF